jgi:hypothetical protein
LGILQRIRHLQRVLPSWKFQRDWDAIQLIVEQLRDPKKRYEKQAMRKQAKPVEAFLPHDVCLECCRFRGRKSRTVYPSLRAPIVQYPSGLEISSEQDPSKKFCRIVKDIEMLGSLVWIWQAFLKSKDQWGHRTIRLQFIPVDRPIEYVIPRDSMHEKLDDMEGTKDFEKSKEAVKQAYSNPKFVGSFYCELQLLDYFGQNSHLPVYPYFGCSKLSYFLC